MALVKYGSTVSELRGSIGGTVYSRNRGGAYIRTRTTPVNPSSSLQVAARTLFAAAVNSWTNTLDAADRSMWEAYAAAVPYTDVFGATRYYTGQQRYVQCYIARVNAGGAAADALTAPSVYTEAENVGSSYLAFKQGTTVAGSTVSVVNATGPSEIAVGDQLLIHFGAPVTSATNYFAGPYRYTGLSENATGTVYPTVVLTDPWARTCASGGVLPVQWRVLKADNRISSAASIIATLGAYSA